MADNRLWTAEEIEFLESRWGSMSVKGIANHLGRGIYGVNKKARRLGLGDPRNSTNGITVKRLSTAINVSYSTMLRWIDKHGFPAKKKLLAYKEKTLIVTYEDFWEWAEQNKKMVNFAKIEPNILGPEPDWVKEKRKADIVSSDRQFDKKWTKEEESRLRGMLNSFSYTYPEIAKILGRSERSLRVKIHELGIKARPVRKDWKEWTDDEVQTLIDLFEKGYGFNTIAEKIGRSAISCYGKLERMGYKGIRRELGS